MSALHSLALPHRAPHDGDEAYDLGEAQAGAQAPALNESEKFRKAQEKREARLSLVLPTWLIKDSNKRLRFYVVRRSSAS
jgi:hypothetical protein